MKINLCSEGSIQAKIEDKFLFNKRDHFTKFLLIKQASSQNFIQSKFLFCLYLKCVNCKQNKFTRKDNFNRRILKSCY